LFPRPQLYVAAPRRSCRRYVVFPPVL
jgi:hypothetical protein